ncbi:hypothetical protein QR680_004951 [Steinernema hermaphroditum]|uniref:Uncharacterized protein n=1 Tax=Steinernema hermaphroditum TaxID=289476 RepID=A0AA39HQC2_9BILA|nr:hypothetical protein QR680_004951 [Steinernema hermaphroditum]
MTENYLLTAHLAFAHFHQLAVTKRTSMDGSRDKPKPFVIPIPEPPRPPPTTFCIDCGDQRGEYSFVYSCAGCSEVSGFQTIHCARCAVQFHERHSTFPLYWPKSSSKQLAARFLSFVKMSKDVKTSSPTETSSSLPSPPPDSATDYALPDISNVILPKRK